MGRPDVANQGKSNVVRDEMCVEDFDGQDEAQEEDKQEARDKRPKTQN